MLHVVENDKSKPIEYRTIAEVARLFRCSPDTIRRRIGKGKLKGIDWVDFFGDGRLRATRDSVERFRLDCHSKMKEHLQAHPRRRGA